MKYKIAVATSDGKRVDLHFGAANVFTIYEVENGTYREIEKREIRMEKHSERSTCEGRDNRNCGNQSGGCKMGENAAVECLKDCRCVLCLKIGHHIQKELERKAISFFDIDCAVEEAMKKICLYYKKVDAHQSLRGWNR